MAVAKAKEQRARPPRAGGRGRGVMRVRAAADVAEIKLAQRVIPTLLAHEGDVRRMLTTYADAVIEAERSGKPMAFTFEVGLFNAPSVRPTSCATGDALDQALEAARQRGAAHVAEIMQSPDMLNAREFGLLIGASHETVNKKRKAGEILALDGTTRGLRYPRWQITNEGRLLPGLSAVMGEIAGGAWGAYRFLLQAHDELGGRTALDALKADRVHDVLDLARSIARGTFA